MLIEDALNDFNTLQKDILDIERAMDTSISSMDRFEKSFELFLESEREYVLKITSNPDNEAYYRLHSMFNEYEKIWRQMADYGNHLRKMGYTGFYKDLQIEMSGLAAIMNRIKEFNDKIYYRR